MRISFVATKRPEGQTALSEMIERYGQYEIEEADYIVAIGGDGTTLRALHATLGRDRKPVFAMRLGASVGFLGNPFRMTNLEARLEQAIPHSFHPLRVLAEDISGITKAVLTINDAALLRQTRLTAKLVVRLCNEESGNRFVGDGVLVATPIGSAAYNRSAGGPLLPVDSHLLALTGIAPYRGVYWSHIALDDSAVITIDVLTPAWRPVRLETDIEELRDIARVEISLARNIAATLLFDPGRRLQARATDSLCEAEQRSCTDASA